MEQLLIYGDENIMSNQNYTQAVPGNGSAGGKRQDFFYRGQKKT
jgi:hypothetical protein